MVILTGKDMSLIQIFTGKYRRSMREPFQLLGQLEFPPSRRFLMQHIY